MKAHQLISYLFVYLIVITDPYAGLNYEEINVYEVNWCNYHCLYYNKEEGESAFIPWWEEGTEKETPYVYYSEGWDQNENDKELQVQSRDKRRANRFNLNNTPSYLQIFQPRL